jgi:(p)ppGpp synthase/HD superfamily hydrolase
MDRIQEALNVVYYAHSNQRDKVGGLYEFHPMRVRDNLASHPAFKRLTKQQQEDAQVAALLHDVIEDSPKHGLRKYKAESLRELGFTERSIELVILMTRSKSIPDETYYASLAGDKVARLVKLADIADNLNAERVEKLEPKVREKLQDKYAKALVAIGATKADDKWLEERKLIEIPYRHWEKSRWIYEWAES